MTTNQTPLNQDGVLAAKEAMRRVLELDSNEARTLAWEAIAPADYPDAVTKPMVTAYLAVAQPVVNSVEELDALPQETVIRSVIFGVVRERMDSGWLATGADEFESTNEIAGRDHVVLHRPEVNDA